jgi:hypothetical protein
MLQLNLGQVTREPFAWYGLVGCKVRPMSARLANMTTVTCFKNNGEEAKKIYLENDFS